MRITDWQERNPREHQGKLGEPVRCSDAKHGAGRGDNDGFDKQLADDAPAAGADRSADGELMPARMPRASRRMEQLAQPTRSRSTTPARRSDRVRRVPC